jgi:hypothetical protein
MSTCHLALITAIISSLEACVPTPHHTHRRRRRKREKERERERSLKPEEGMKLMH